MEGTTGANEKILVKPAFFGIFIVIKIVCKRKSLVFEISPSSSAFRHFVP